MAGFGCDFMFNNVKPESASAMRHEQGHNNTNIQMV